MKTHFTRQGGFTSATGQPAVTKLQFDQATLNQTTEMKTKEKTMIPKLFKYGASALSLSLALALAPCAPPAQAQVPPIVGAPASSQFDITGFLQAASVDNVADNLSGGKLTVNGHVVIVPKNLLVIFPANQLSWAQVFQQAPAPYTGVASGMALTDIPAPLASYEVHVVGNRVGDTYIAGLIDISQQGLNSGSGYINYIDYAKGEMRVGGVLNNATTGARVQINDPAIWPTATPGVFKGRFSRGQSPDVRFTLDPENPTIRTETAYPMGLPDVASDPTVAGNPDDPLRPQNNRPKIGNLAFTTVTMPAVGNYLTIFTMRDPAVAPVVGGNETDPMFEAPFEVGDYVTYSGTLVKDGPQPTAGPMPADPAATYISAHTIIASLGIFTVAGTQPAYIAIDVTILGVGGVTPVGLGEATTRTRFEGFSTDSSRIVTLWGLDQTCDTGTLSDRNWGSIDVDPGPGLGGAVKGRWRFRPPGKVLTMPAAGAFLPPTRMVHAVIPGAWPPIAPATGLSGNGLTYGQYMAPILEYLFPENVPGTTVPPNNFETFPFLAKGSGPLAGGLAGELVTQLNPWPGALATVPPTCNGTPANPLPPVAVAGPNQSVPSHDPVVTLDGSASFDPNGVGLTAYAWTQTSGPLVALSAPAAAITTFTAPLVPFATIPAPVVLTFSLTVTSAAGGTSPPSTMTVTVNPPAVAPTPIALAGAFQTVSSASPVTLNGTASSDPNGAALTYAWTQTGGTPVTLAGATTATPTFTAPTLIPGSPNSVLSFTLVVNNGFNSSLPDATTVTVQAAAAQPPVANAGLAQTVASDAAVTLNGTGSTDPNGLTLTYVWLQTGGPAVTLASANSAVTTFTAPHVPFASAAALLTFQLTVQNSATLTSTATVSITVNPAVLLNPTANAGAAQTVPSASLVTLHGTASDPNVPALPLTFTWTQTTGPAVVLTGGGTLTPTFTSPTVAAGNQPAVLTFVLTAQNSGGRTAVSSTTVTVNPTADLVIVTSVEYRTGKSRLTVNATDNVVSPTLRLFLEAQPAINLPRTQMQNLGGGLYQLIFTGVGQPTSVTVTSDLGGVGTLNNTSANWRTRQ